MKTSKRLMKTKTALVAAALACVAGAANAGGPVVIGFENVTNTGLAPWLPLLGNGDEIVEQGYWMDPFSNSGAPRNGDLVGVIVDGTQLADTCFGVTCPTNNSSHFLTTLNDGVLAMGTMDGHAFTIQGLDAAFLGAAGEMTPSTAGILRVLGVRASDNEAIAMDFSIGGPDQFGTLSFSHFVMTGDFATTAFSTVYLYGGACDASGNCSLFDNNRGQFALDNLSVTAVPEPSQWLLLAAGLGALGGISRRRLQQA
ncbi:NF038120 family PEP-CTERM protein [Burkholderiaceae bacterium UC74_6]